MLVWCWPVVCETGPWLTQHWVSAEGLLNTLPASETLNQCWVNAGPPSTTSGQHWPNIGSMYRVCWGWQTTDNLYGSDVSTEGMGLPPPLPPPENSVLTDWFETVQIRNLVTCVNPPSKPLHSKPGMESYCWSSTDQLSWWVYGAKTHHYNIFFVRPLHSKPGMESYCWPSSDQLSW